MSNATAGLLIVRARRVAQKLHVEIQRGFVQPRAEFDNLAAEIADMDGWLDEHGFDWRARHPQEPQ